MEFLQNIFGHDEARTHYENVYTQPHEAKFSHECTFSGHIDIYHMYSNVTEICQCSQEQLDSLRCTSMKNIFVAKASLSPTKR